MAASRCFIFNMLFVVPRGANHMTQPDTDQYQSGVAVWDVAHHPSVTADLLVQPFNNIAGVNSRLMFAGKITVCQCLCNTVLNILRGFFQFH